MDWRSIPGSQYEASSMGDIRNARNGHVLSPIRMHDGYLRVRLGRGSHYRVHRLVLLAFVGPCPDGKEVNHKDANRGNNALSNLEYVTHRENLSNVAIACRPGSDHYKAKLSDEDVRVIRRKLDSGARPVDLAKEFGIHPGTVRKIKRGETWPHLIDFPNRRVFDLTDG